MRVFFKKMGIEQVRFKPAYNPYTEVRNPILLPQLCFLRPFFLALLGNLRLPPDARPMG